MSGCHYKGHGFKKGNLLASHPAQENGRYSHGECVSGRSPEYQAFYNAKQRCLNPKNTRYKDWGGRGIKFLFNSFEEFLLEVGRKPSPQYVLDRKDNNGHYEIGNVRWITKSESAKNKRANGGAKFRDPQTGKFIKEVIC